MLKFQVNRSIIKKVRVDFRQKKFKKQDFENSQKSTVFGGVFFQKCVLVSDPPENRKNRLFNFSGQTSSPGSALQVGINESPIGAVLKKL